MHETTLLYDRIHDTYRCMCTCGWATGYVHEFKRACNIGDDHQESHT